MRRSLVAGHADHVVAALFMGGMGRRRRTVRPLASSIIRRQRPAAHDERSGEEDKHGESEQNGHPSFDTGSSDGKVKHSLRDTLGIIIVYQIGGRSI